jgi:hypothetical protein
LDGKLPRARRFGKDAYSATIDRGYGLNSSPRQPPRSFLIVRGRRDGFLIVHARDRSLIVLGNEDKVRYRP